MEGENIKYIKFQLFYLAMFFGFGTFFPYFSVYLEQEIGLSGSEIGIISFTSLVISGFAGLVWGAVGDKTGKYKLLLKGLLLLYAGTAFFLYQARTLSLIILLTIILESFGIGVNPFADILATFYCDQEKRSFGGLRAFASLGFVAGTFAVGYLVSNDILGLGKAVFGLTILFFLLSTAITFFLPDHDNEMDKSEPETNNKKKGFKTLFANKAFVFIVVFNFLVPAVIDSAFLYLGNHLVLTLGATEMAISLFNAIAVLPEILFFFIATKFMEKIGFKNFYILATLTLILRFIVYSLTYNVNLFLVVSIGGPLAGAMIVIGNVIFIKENVDENLIGTAFMVITSVITLGRALFSYAFGVLYEYFSSFSIFQVSFVLLLIALAMLLKTKHFVKLDSN